MGADLKSRKERRKDSRLAKNKNKFDSWVVHQQSCKSKKSVLNSKSESKNLPLDISVIDSAENPPRKRKKSNSKDMVAKKDVGSEDHSRHLSSMYDSKVTVPKTNKVSRQCSKNNFTQFLEMEMGGSLLSAEEDLRLERKLAKKLKLKNGNLSAANDDIDVLLEGISSGFDSRAKNKKIPDTAGSVVLSGGDMISNSESEEIEDNISVNESIEDSDASISSFEELDDNEEDEIVCNEFGNGKRQKLGFQDSVDEQVQAFEYFQNKESEATLPSKKNKTSRVSKKERSTAREIDSDVGEQESKLREKAQVEAPKKYVAPHLRSQGKSDSADHAQLRKRVRGLLNKLSETNVESLTNEISTLFHTVGRSICSLIICEEVVASCSSGPRGSEQYAAVFAAFVAGISCLVGIDFGAKLLSLLAIRFEAEYSKEDNLSLRNLTLLLSYLFVFGVCSSELVYDFLMVLSNGLTEVDVSTVLTVLQCCGMKLRGDNPSGMKAFISSVQTKANELKISSETGTSNTSGKRMEFMLETICDIKNNKKKPKEDTHLHTQVKRWLQKLKVENILIQGVKWTTLLDPDKKGQWWLPGDFASTTEKIEEVAGNIDKEIPETKKMLQLAAAQRMNTDARRAIFCIIMSGEDYIDAFEKLLRLDLPGKQDREIMRVLVDCCLQEKVFNKYYCLLASKLCGFEKNHKFTLQYCLWDHFKELDSMPLARSMHLSKFIAEMIQSFNLSLAVLKAVELDNIIQLTPKRIMHFRMLFEAIFEFPDNLVWNIFTRIALNPEYEPLRSGIQFFVSNYVVDNKQTFAKKFKLARKALSNVEGILM